jgi:MFS family permease
MARVRRTIRPAWLPVLVTYFCYGASTVTAVAEVFFQKQTLGITPAEIAGIAFWLGLPWSMKMVAGVASDAYPILGSRRAAYMLVGAAATLGGYLALALLVDTRPGYLAASLLIAVGFMIQDVVADALSVEVARTDEELGQIQTFGRIALLAGSISVGYLSGWMAGALGARATFLGATLLPLLVAATVPLVRPVRRRERPGGVDDRPRDTAAPAAPADPLAGGKARVVLLVGLAYAALGALLELLQVPLAQETVLVVSIVLIGVLLAQVGISRAVAIASIVIFLFRATPAVGQGYTFWAIDGLGFDERFLGVLAQAGSIVSLAGLLVFRKTIVKRPVSFTLFWVVIAGCVLSVPNIGLFYGVHEWLGVSARALAFIDTTISAPLAQLTMVPMLILIARTAPAGGEATMFAIMASLMNLALSTSQLFTRHLSDLFAVTQQDYSNLGRLMITVALLGLVPLLALPLLWREERLAAAAARPHEPPLDAPVPSSTAP